MKYLIVASALVAMTGCTTVSPTHLDISSSGDIASYTFGYEAGNGVRNGLASQRLDQQLFLQGVQDALNSQPARHSLSEDEIAAALEEHSEWVKTVTEEEKRVASEKNSAEGNAFRESYASRQGTLWLDDEIQYTVLSTGTGGQHPRSEDTVEVHYEGKLPDGTVFDSSFERGEPEVVDLTRVISGWKTAIPRMTPGDEWEIVLPPSQAYGAPGRAPAIGPEQTLIFRIKLISII